MQNDTRSRQVSLYQSILKRAVDAWHAASEKALPSLQEEVRRAAEFEAEVEDLAADERALLGEYVHRDLARLTAFVAETGRGLADWMRFDLEYLEDGIRQSLVRLADPSVLEGAELEHRLASEDSELRYTSGELACGGSFCCDSCGEEQRLTRVEHLRDCTHCGHPYFTRVSNR